MPHMQASFPRGRLSRRIENIEDISTPVHTCAHNLICRFFFFAAVDILLKHCHEFSSRQHMLTLPDFQFCFIRWACKVRRRQPHSSFEQSRRLHTVRSTLSTTGWKTTLMASAASFLRFPEHFSQMQSVWSLGCSYVMAWYERDFSDTFGTELQPLGSGVVWYNPGCYSPN